MELDPLTAQVGYKFDNDPKRGEPKVLTCEEDLRQAMDHGLEKIRRARTRRVVMEIYNLVSTSNIIACKHTHIV